MTPKVYDEVSSKLAAVWGDYAGWAHSVRLPIPFTRSSISCVRVGPIHIGFEVVLFVWSAVTFTDPFSTACTGTDSDFASKKIEAHHAASNPIIVSK